jgi:predicted 3-demethylubiquinone-9 3-methyltransferase (glyoxalase superfamily)
MQKIRTCLWFDSQALEAATFYVSVFPNSRIVGVTRYLEGTPGPTGSVMTVEFVLDGAEFVALNGDTKYAFSPAISLVANCTTQEEVDHLWRSLCEGGNEVQCGWLTDKYGVSWQVVPVALMEMLSKTDTAASQRAIAVMLRMKKLDIAALRRAYDNA